MEVGLSQLEPGPEALRRGKHGHEPGNQEIEVAPLPEVPVRQIDLLANHLVLRRDHLLGHPGRSQGRRIEHELVGRPVPDHDGPRVADRVEVFPGEASVEVVVVSPRDQRCCRVLHGGGRSAQ